MTIYTCSKTSYITFNTINFNIYIVDCIVDCFVVFSDFVINSSFDIFNCSTNFTVQCFNSFCILIDSDFVITDEFTVFDSNCTSYINIFFVLVNTFSKTIQITFNAINFNIYIVDCRCIISNICSINFNTIFYSSNTCRVIYNVIL